MSYPIDYNEKGQYHLGVKYTIKDMDKYALDFIEFFKSHRKRNVLRRDIILEEFKIKWLSKRA